MRITRSMYAIYKALEDGRWHSAGEIAAIVGSPPQNLKYSLESLLKAGFLEKDENVRPFHFRLTTEAGIRDSFVTQVTKVRSIFEEEAS